MKLVKNDFIEIEFIGKIKEDGKVFDTNIKEELEKLNPEYNKEQTKPFIFSLGQGMFLEGVDNFLIGKEIGKYIIELSAEKAFGNRNPKLIQMIPMKIFVEHKINPVPGVVFNFDGRLAKILTVSGGRVMVDFNHPIAGKEIIYEVNILRKLEKIEEKIKAFVNFLFRQDFNFEIKDKILVLELDSQLVQFALMFKDKFKEVFDLDLEVKAIESAKK